MLQINENDTKLPGSYLFSTIGKKVNEYVDYANQVGDAIILVSLPLEALKIQKRQST